MDGCMDGWKGRRREGGERGVDVWREGGKREHESNEPPDELGA